MFLAMNIREWNNLLNKTWPMRILYNNPNILIRLVERSRIGTIRKLCKELDGILFDIGCEEGFVLYSLTDHFSRLIGLDISDVALKNAKKFRDKRNITSVELILCDAHHLPLKSNIDGSVILCSEVLEHLVDPIACLREMKRVATSSSTILITTPNDKLIGMLKLYLKKMRLVHRLRINPEHAEGHIIAFDLRKAENLIAKILRVVKVIRIPSRFLGIRYLFICKCT